MLCAAEFVMGLAQNPRHLVYAPRYLCSYKLVSIG